MIRLFTRLCVLGLVIVGLTACSGGGGGSDPVVRDDITLDVTTPATPIEDVNANGFWTGTFTEAGQTYALDALLFDGEIVAISKTANMSYSGSYTISGDTLDGSVFSFIINSSPQDMVSLVGTVIEQDHITATLQTINAQTVGTISLDFNDSMYFQPSSFERIAGTWNYHDYSTTYGFSITVQQDGTFWGQDVTGCVFAGSTTILDSTVNLYGLLMEVSNCGLLDGVLDGFATITNSNPDTLLIAAMEFYGVIDYMSVYSLTR